MNRTVATRAALAFMIVAFVAEAMAVMAGSALAQALLLTSVCVGGLMALSAIGAPAPKLVRVRVRSR